MGMRATGVIRKIDELGRLVVPKELRKAMRIKEGDGLEIFVEGEYILLKKYNYIKSITETLEELKSAINDEDSIKEKAALIAKADELGGLLKQEEETA